VSFFGTFWSTLLGALVGAAATWLFALDLRRRERSRSHEDDFNASVARVIGLLGDFSAAVQAFQFTFVSQSDNIRADPPQIARARLLAAIREARIIAKGSEEEPIKALFELVTDQKDDTANKRGLAFEVASEALVRWRRGEISTNDATMQVRYPRVDAIGASETE
jgi:hypothetical protein